MRSSKTATTNKKVSIKVPEKVVIEEPVSKISIIKTANKIKDKYLKIRCEKSKKLTDQYKKSELTNVTDAIENVSKSSDKKEKKVAAEKILKKYKNLKKSKKTYLVSEKDIETIDYLSPDEERAQLMQPTKFLTIINLKRIKV